MKKEAPLEEMKHYARLEQDRVSHPGQYTAHEELRGELGDFSTYQARLLAESLKISVLEREKASEEMK